MRIRPISALLLALACASIWPSYLFAQYSQLEPMACPYRLNQFRVAVEAPSGEKYFFVADWIHASNIGSGVSSAFYDVDTTLGPYSPLGLTSDDGKARWKYPGIYVSCHKRVYYRADRSIENVVPIYRVEYTEGDIQELASTCGPKTSYAEYDPYAPTNDEDCSHDGSGSGGGSGIQFEPGDSTGGETVDWQTGIGNGGVSACGTAATVEYICIDLWNDFEQKWDLYSCGYATTC
ncbi:MAG TPA: hypothetical protein VFJ16_17015 [Longimicrobium sp.]|nr:hypothetical protein [Longimicrobium sp.]